VENIWWIAGAGALTLAVQALIAAAWMVLGGMGGTWRMNQTLLRQTDEIHRIDERITREVKTRAAHAAVEAKVEARTGGNLKEEALRTMAAESPPSSTTRPSTAHLIGGGR